ncbi:MAG: DUF4113 domain-containing protein [Pseudomonas sp.]
MPASGLAESAAKSPEQQCMRCEMMSQSYTTRLDQLWTVHCK